MIKLLQLDNSIIYYFDMMYDQFYQFTINGLYFYCMKCAYDYLLSWLSYVTSGQFHSSNLQRYEKLHGAYHSPSQRSEETVEEPCHMPTNNCKLIRECQETYLHY